MAATAGALVAFLDDDVWVPPGWLAALAAGAEAHPEADAFGGPIRARLEGPAPARAGARRRPSPPWTWATPTAEAELVWGANFAVRRSAFERLGGFDEDIAGLRRRGGVADGACTRSGGRIAYLAAAGLDHRRAGEDARLRRAGPRRLPPRPRRPAAPTSARA